MKTATVHVDVDTPRASGQRTGWWKKVVGVKREEAHRGGYSLVGEFLDPGMRAVDVGSILVRCEPTGSSRNGSKMVVVKAVMPSGVIDLTHPVRDRPELDLKLEIDLIHELVEMGLLVRPMDRGNALSVFSNDELIKEINRRGYDTIPHDL